MTDEPAGTDAAFGEDEAGGLRGWGNYFRKGNADREFDKMDYFVVKSLRRRQYRRGGQRPAKRAPFTGNQLHGMGLHKLMGTVKYQAPATSVRSLLSPVREKLSRVRENRMRALKGESGNGPAKAGTMLDFYQ